MKKPESIHIQKELEVEYRAVEDGESIVYVATIYKLHAEGFNFRCGIRLSRFVVKKTTRKISWEVSSPAGVFFILSNGRLLSYDSGYGCLGCLIGAAFNKGILLNGNFVEEVFRPLKQIVWEYYQEMIEFSK
jgi:hypothetical protein